MIVIVIFTGMSRPFDPMGMLERTPNFLQFIFLGLVFSYAFGGLQALGAGIMVAAYGLGIGRPNYFVAAIVAIVTFAGTLLFGPPMELKASIIMFFIQIGASLICWHIAKRFWNEPA